MAEGSYKVDGMEVWSSVHVLVDVFKVVIIETMVCCMFTLNT